MDRFAQRLAQIFRRPPSAPPAADNGKLLHYFVDTPTAWERLGRSLIVRGWCFGADGRPIRGVRLKLPGLVAHGATGLPRPDVKAAYPEAPDGSTGFELRTMLPRGRFALDLQVQQAAGPWVSLLRRSARADRWRRPFWMGGGTNAELVAFQLPAHPTHPPRPLRPDRYPAPTATGPHPQLAIVTPSFNQAAFLETCLVSVHQGGASVAHVVQDGGSPDGSVETLRRHAGRLSAWESAPDGGQADAIGRGFAKTTGRPNDLMAWINSDDFYLPGALGFVVDWFARHPEADVLYGHRILVDEESREIGRWLLPRHDDAVLRLNDFIPQETLFWRRRIWERVGGIDPAFQFAIDWDLLLRFQAAGARIVRVPYFLGCFRIHAAQKTMAAMQRVGQGEIDRLRARTHGRLIAPEEIEHDPRIVGYLRRSAWVEQLWRCGFRAP